MTIRLPAYLLGAMALSLAAHAQTTVQGPINYGSGQAATVLGPQTVTTSGTVTVSSGANVNFVATSSITLNAGFSCSGSTFEASVDNTPPSTPQSLSVANQTAGSIALTWTASTDNFGGVTYDIFLNGSLVGSTAATSFTLTGLSPNTSYTITVNAHDALGNTSTSGSYALLPSPVFSPGAGFFPAPLSVSISSATSGATIYYTMDGSMPTTSSKKYSGPISMPVAVTTLNAIAFTKTGMSVMASGVYNVTQLTNPTPPAGPAFTPGTGTYAAPQNVTITDPTSGAAIYYTTDGSAPTPSSPKYSNPIALSAGTTFVQAIAVNAAGSSGVTSGSYTVPQSVPPAPSFSPASGSYTAPEVVTITDAANGATIQYTMDGSTPTTASTVYTGPITLPVGATTLSAIAVNGSGASSVTTGSYTVTQAVVVPDPPAFSPAPGAYTDPQTVTITDSSGGAPIHYTTDGSTPTAASTVYTGPVSLQVGTTLVQAIAVNTVGASTVTIGSYTVNPTGLLPQVSFSPAPGEYPDPQSVAITGATSGVTIFYTTDGSLPTTSSMVYKAGVQIPLPVGTTPTTTTLSAIAVNSTGQIFINGSYTVDPPTGPSVSPVFSPVPGIYTADKENVTITDSASDATIYYTTDGSTPTTSSTPYSGPITVYGGKTTVLSAIAVNSIGPSVPAGGAYTLNPPTVPPLPPSFSPASGGTYPAPQSVTLADATSGATIYYTTDGTTPGISSTMYTGPISLPAGLTTTLTAIAIDSGGSSPQASGAYTVNSLTVAPPVFSPAPGILYADSQSVTITDPNAQNVTIYYTTDGSSPTTSSTTQQYQNPLTLVTGTTTQINAAAIDNNDFGWSAVTSGSFTVNKPLSAPPPPTFNPAINGSYAAASSGTLGVTINDATSGVTIYYTTDGSSPATSSTAMLYTGSVSLPVGTKTLTAIASDTGGTSGATSGYYAVTPPVQSPPAPPSPPSFNPTPGNYTTTMSGSLANPLTITVTDSVQNATIFYTTNGTTPQYQMDGTTLTPEGTSTQQYSSGVPIQLPVGSTVLTVIAVNNGLSSIPAGGEYTVNLPSAPSVPAVNPASGTYTDSQRFTITEPGATIYYTTNGSIPDPSNSAEQYTGPIQLPDGTPTLNAIAVNSAGTSGETTCTYIITMTETLPLAPVFSPAPGNTTSYSGESVSITDATAGATIYYTTNESTPTVESPVYTGSITIPDDGQMYTVQAVAINGAGSSPIASASYTVTLPPPPSSPTFSNFPGQGKTYTVYQSTPLQVTITAASGATVYYTTDTSQPGPGSPSFTSGMQIVSIPVGGAATELQAIAYDSTSGESNGIITSCFYQVTSPIGQLQNPTFNPAGGPASNAPVSLPVSSATGLATINITNNALSSYPNAVIEFTTNGDTPGLGDPSEVYNGPITISDGDTLTIYAVAYDSSTGFSSDVVNASYAAGEPPTRTLSCGPSNSAVFFSDQNISMDANFPQYVSSGTLAADTVFTVQGDQVTLTGGTVASFSYDPGTGELVSASGTLGDELDSTTPGGTIAIPKGAQIVFGGVSRKVTFPYPMTYTLGGQTFTFAAGVVNFTPTSISGNLTPGQSLLVAGGQGPVSLAAAPATATLTSDSISGSLVGSAYLSLYGYNIWFGPGPLTSTGNSFTGTLLEQQSFLVDGGISIPFAANTSMTISGTSGDGVVGYNISGTLAGYVRLPFFDYTVNLGPGPVNVTNNSLTGTLNGSQSFQFEGMNITFDSGTSATFTGNSISGTISSPLHNLPFNGYTVNFAAGPVTFTDSSSSGIGNSITGMLDGVQSFPIEGGLDSVRLAPAPATFKIVSISQNVVSTNITGILSGSQSFLYNGGQSIVFASGTSVTLDSNSISGTLANPMTFSLNGQTVYLAAAPITIAGAQYISSGTLANSPFQGAFKVSYNGSSVSLSLAPNTTATFNATSLLSGTLNGSQYFPIPGDSGGGVTLSGQVSVGNGGSTITGSFLSGQYFDFHLGNNQYGQAIFNSGYFLPGTAVIAVNGTAISGTLSSTQMLYSSAVIPGVTVQAGTFVTFQNGAYTPP
jgi:hypothetical protein